METHQPDPTSDQSTDSWDSVSSELSSLGGRLKETYRRVASEEGPSEGEIKEALATLARAWDQVAGSFSTALNDPATRAHLRKAAGSLAAAMGATLAEVGAEIRGEGSGSGVEESAGPPPSPEPHPEGED